jgi:uncharacterized membrane protein YeaQ/YmgE (transglycosylase-associated protein family)
MMTIALLTIGVATAQSEPQVLDWKALGADPSAAISSPNEDAPFGTIAVEGPRTFRLATLDPPKIQGQRWAIRGFVRYEGVEGHAYLETWQTVGGGEYFTRSLADHGPMGVLSGRSDWRAFELPFDATGAGLPTKLVLNVVLPGGGRVELGRVEVVDFDGAGGGLTEQDVGGIVGSLGALFGVLAGVMGTLASMGRFRGAVRGIWLFLVLGCVGSLVAGVVLAATDHAMRVSGPFFFLAVLGLLILLPLARTISKRFEAAELRRMQAMDRA